MVLKTNGTVKGMAGSRSGWRQPFLVEMIYTRSSAITIGFILFECVNVDESHGYFDSKFVNRRMCRISIIRAISRRFIAKVSIFVMGRSVSIERIIVSM